jgi:hypothetical protein
MAGEHILPSSKTIAAKAQIVSQKVLRNLR